MMRMLSCSICQPKATVVHVCSCLRWLLLTWIDKKLAGRLIGQNVWHRNLQAAEHTGLPSQSPEILLACVCQVAVPRASPYELKDLHTSAPSRGGVKVHGGMTCAIATHQRGFINQCVLLPCAFSSLSSPGHRHHSGALL